MDIAAYKYSPILALQPAEMAALEELPEKDKDLILPYISLKGWVASKKLENSISRIEKAFGKRKVIVDIDKDFLVDNKGELTGRYPDRAVFNELDELLEAKEGYRNWVNFLSEHKNFVPVLQLGDLSEIGNQIDSFHREERFFVVRIKLEKGKRISSEDFNFIIRTLLLKKVGDFLFVLDYGDIGRENLLERNRYAELIRRLSVFFPSATFSLSGTSFPYSFAGAYKGELPIYERQIYEYVAKENSSVKMIYSDRGSARAGKMGGGSGSVPVRIDYPLKNDWRFIRKEPEEGKEKDLLYQEAAVEMMSSDYWDNSIPLWGTQMIERTSLRDPYAITSPSKATAARINIHLFQQLHYHDHPENIDTEEDWED